MPLPTDPSAIDRFTVFLRDGNYRITSERFDVLEQVLRNDDHFDADSLYLQLRGAGSKVSRATVYKTLALLHQCGLVSRYLFAPGDFAQYEKTVGRPDHDHMVCTACNRIFEFPNSSVADLQRQICAMHDFHGAYHTLQIFGVCAECRAERNAPVEAAGAPMHHSGDAPLSPLTGAVRPLDAVATKGTRQLVEQR